MSTAVVVGALRIRVVQATDLPTAPASATTAEAALGSGSWLRYPTRRQNQSQSRARPSASLVSVLLHCSGSRAPLLATATLPSGPAVVWNEEFFLDGVSSEDAVTFFCVDRAKNEPCANLPLLCEAATACAGYIGKARLPEGEEVEQWYPLAPKEPFRSLRTALRVALCFTPSGGKARLRVESTAQLERRVPVPLLPATAITEISSASPVAAPSKLRLQVPSSLSSSSSPAPSPVSIHLKTGVVDYAIVVGADPAARESSLLFRYPATDRVGFPLPTKIEWFCFPGGPEVVLQPSRPRSTLFSFVLVGGDDGTSRTYAVCLTVFHRRKHARPDAWHATCVAFLTRVPLIRELEQCLLAFAHTWLVARVAAPTDGCSTRPQLPLSTLSPEELLVDLCHRVLIPVRGVFSVRFTVASTPISLAVPASVSIYSAPGRGMGAKRTSQTGRFSPTKSPTTNFINIQQGFQPLVYSLAPIFQLLDIKTVIHLVALVLCEYRVLLHSNHFSLLCPFAEGLCALIYPFRWQHPYIPILPRVLSEYLQAPLPYILGVHTSWLPALLENGRPEHLVIVDIDRGTIQLQDSTSPMLPARLTKGLYQRIKRIIHPDVFSDSDAADSAQKASPFGPATQAPVGSMLHWDAGVEKQVRVEFVCFLAAMLMGYRDCLLFVNQRLPVFNKRRYFATCASDSEVVPFVTKLFCTQAFQSFLETHSAMELSVFHSVYLTFSRTKDLEWPQSMPLMSIAAGAFPRSGREPSGVPMPAFVMPRNPDTSADASSAEFAAPNSQDAMEHDEAAQPSSGERDAATPSTLGLKIEAALDQLDVDAGDLFVASIDELDALYARDTLASCCDYKQVAQGIGVEPRLFEEYAELFRDPHATNQSHGLQLAKGNVLSAVVVAGNGGSGGGGGGANARSLSNDEERTEQVLHKCLTSVFASDDMLTPEDIRLCETRFKLQYARDLFVLILMQPSHQYVEMNSAAGSSGGNGANSGTWYNPKGSGNCIGESGFQVLARLASTLMDQCAVHEDFTNARGMLQVAFQYYRFVEDKHSGVGFAKKEYLVTPLRLRPVCRSLDMWQHAFMREIDGALLADPTVADESNPGAVADELFFSVIGSLVYDMLTVEMPVPKDASKAPLHKIPAAVAPVPAPASVLAADAASPLNGVAPSRQYDLDTVIRRKMSTNDVAVPTRSPASRPVSRGGGANASESAHAGSSSSSVPSQRRVARSPFPCTVLLSQSSPILSMDNYQGRVACGLADASISVVETACADKSVRLQGHTDAVVAVQLRGNTLVSGSRDHTLRAWDLRPTPKKRQLFSFFSSGSGQHHSLGSTNEGGGGELDGASVSRLSMVWKGHTGAITCLEMGRQLSTDRSLIGSGSEDGTIRLWDTSRETSVALLGNGKAGVSCLRFLALHDYLVSGCREYSLKVWDLSESKLRTNIQAHRGAVLDIQITGDRLVTASNDRTVKVWDAHFRAGGAQSYVHALRDHGGPVRCVCLGGPADPNICTGSSDGVVRVWDLRYAQKGPRLSLSGHLGAITSLQRDFTKLVSASEDGSFRVWDMHSGVCIKDAKAHMSGITAAALRDSLVYSSSWDGSARLWDIDAANASSTALSTSTLAHRAL
ncbi:hypothetical protein PybrP1_003991 [[Pythium] brassicae (nom. inval.)]|nr:hypothetical protein PybrP1_003991 [[Pythium] brassicae (nom. inval.)]